VSSLKNDPAIVMWNISNTPLRAMDYFYYKPDLLYAREYYISWLSKLINDIKAIDPVRPVSVDIEVDDNLNEYAGWLHRHIPAIDCFGLVAGSDVEGSTHVEQFPWPYFFSKITAADYAKRHNITASGFFIAN